MHAVVTQGPYSIQYHVNIVQRLRKSPVNFTHVIFFFFFPCARADCQRPLLVLYLQWRIWTFQKFPVTSTLVTSTSKSPAFRHFDQEACLYFNLCYTHWMLPRRCKPVFLCYVSKVKRDQGSDVFLNWIWLCDALPNVPPRFHSCDSCGWPFFQ